ncbi:single-stranded DNA-binding protein [Microbacterium amylolyticum]|uniref:single-stranded DNA-binding protein n=1 Tax=Microbacterium amylolyticum TaxID=936337 RepID=UPI00361FBFA2
MSSITFAGNLAEEVELRYAQNGRAMARFRVLENRRTRNADGEWVDAEPNAWRVQVWGDMAENVAASCHKGDRVHITATSRPTSGQIKRPGRPADRRRSTRAKFLSASASTR